MTEIESLKKELAEAKAKIQDLEMRLGNVTFLLRKEMRATGKLPPETNGDQIAKFSL